MADSVVDICNKALSRTGTNKFIVSFDEDTAEAATCRVLYPEALRTVLEEAAWPFAKTRATLAEIDHPTPHGGFNHIYALPTDCLSVLEVWGGRRLRSEQRVPYSVEHLNGEKVLLTDHPCAEIAYIALVQNPTLFPASFVDALAWQLAGDLAFALAAEPSMEVLARQRYEMALSRALAHAAAEQQPDPDAAPDYLTARI